MKFNFENSLILDEELHSLEVKQSDYLGHLQKVSDKKGYSENESSINLPFDENLLKVASDLKEKLVSPNFKYIIDIGIGGSNLGTKAIYDAMFGYFDLLETNRFPKVLFADTNDGEFLEKLVKLLEDLNKDEILINVISKSGGTTETMVNLEVIFGVVKDRLSNIKKRMVITTDEESALWNLAKAKNIETLSIPQKVGGRYSVFSSVGLFPLSCCGVNIESLLTGARLAVGNMDEALKSAIVLYLSNRKGFIINDNFFFHPELESLGKWYRQLMGESIGKEKDLEGETIHAGLTPTVSIGSTDLHSMGQLYLGGPRDKITTFVSVQNGARAKIPEQLNFPGLVASIDGKDTGEIMSAILEGVKNAYQKKGLPFMEIILDDLSEKSLGYFMQFKMIEIMCLGKLFDVNSFDQPNVEEYKMETKKILAG